MGPLIPIGMAAASFLKGLFGGIAKKKQLKEQARANERQYAAGKASWEGGEANRAARVGLAGSQLSAVQPTLQKGAPNYTIDPAMLAKIQAARPYAGSLPADPSKGAGWQFLSGLAGGAGDAFEQIALGKLSQQSSTGGGGMMQLPGQTDLCAKYPMIPGCR